MEEKNNIESCQTNLSPSDFMYLFLNTLKSNGLDAFDYTDLENFIIQCKEANLYKKLLKNVTVKSRNDQYYLPQIEEILHLMQEKGLLDTISNSKKKIFIVNTKNISFDDYTKRLSAYLSLINGFTLGVIDDNNFDINADIPMKSKRDVQHLYIEYTVLLSKLGILEAEEEKLLAIPELKAKYDIYQQRLNEFKTEKEKQQEVTAYLEESENTDLRKLISKKSTREILHQRLVNISLWGLTITNNVFLRENNELLGLVNGCDTRLLGYDEKIKSFIVTIMSVRENIIHGFSFKDADLLKQLMVSSGKSDYCSVCLAPDTFDIAPEFGKRRRFVIPNRDKAA